MKWLTPLLKIFFRLLYGPFAWTYDLVAATVSVGQWRGWVFAVLPYLDGPRVLELGHGPGHLQQALCQRGQCAFGLDASPQMGRLARRRLQRAGQAARLTRGLAQQLPYPAGRFDQVVATFPTEYIVHPHTLAEIKRVLKPGGELLIVPTAWISGRGWLHRAAATLFAVTGQAPAWEKRLLAPFRQARFEVQVEWIEQPHSRLLLIRAFSPNESSPRQSQRGDDKGKR
jgi:ubiquinone/menaquinone biosynthesis C-methylase UbiE